MGWGTSILSETNGAGSPVAEVVLINVDMYDNFYGEANNNLNNPPVWTVQTGADVVATLANHGRRNHNWAIIKSGVTVPIPYDEGQGGGIILHGMGMVYGNSQTTMTFSAPAAGEYLVICTVSGHYPEMQGRLLVTPPSN
jgi:plastocyanin